MCDNKVQSLFVVKDIVRFVRGRIHQILESLLDGFCQNGADLWKDGHCLNKRRNIMTGMVILGILLSSHDHKHAAEQDSPIYLSFPTC